MDVCQETFTMCKSAKDVLNAMIAKVQGYSAIPNFRSAKDVF